MALVRAASDLGGKAKERDVLMADAETYNVIASKIVAANEKFVLAVVKAALYQASQKNDVDKPTADERVILENLAEAEHELRRAITDALREGGSR